MRVVLNQQAALGLKTGIGHYAVQLLRCLRQQEGEDQIDEFPTGWFRHVRAGAARARPYLEPKDPGQKPGEDKPRRPLSRLRGQLLGHLRQAGRVLVARRFRSVCRRQHYDLYHEPNFIPLPCDCPTVTTLHDLSVLLHPEWHPVDRVAHFERHFRRGLDQCVHFLTVSDFGRQEVIQTLGVAPERVTRVYNGIRPELAPLPPREVVATLQRLGLPSRYLLAVGTIEPRKNLLMLLKAYCALPERLRGSWPLLLVGSWGWNSADVADYLHREARHRGVIHLGYVGEDNLAAVYNGARALVYPSLYEGFGLPPVEMMACGGAVLASTAGAVAEVVGRRAYLIPPDDEAGWSEAMARVLEDDDWWQSLRTGVEAVARPYTWDRCAMETLGVYRSLLGIHSPERRRAA